MSTLNALDATLDVPNACPITAVSIVIAESSNSGPAYITAGNTIQLHANLSPAGASVPSGEQVIWKVESQPNGSPTIPVPDPDSQSLDMTVEPSFTFPGTYEISVTVCCRQAFFTSYAYDLKLKSVTDSIR